MIAVDHFGLREIRNLGRAGAERDCREKIILHDGPQQRVGAQRFGRRIRELQNFSLGQNGVADFVGAGSPAALALINDRLAEAVANLKEQRRFGRDFYLGLESGAFELFISLQQFRVQRRALRQRLAIDRRRDAMQPRIQRIDENQSVIREDSRKQFSEGAAVGLVGRVALLQIFRDAHAIGPGEKL